MKIVWLITLSLTMSLVNAQTDVKMNAGIVTDKIKESKEFYSNVLNFGVTFENEFYLLMHTPNKSAEISFLLPNLSTQEPVFQGKYTGEGMYLTIEVDDVDAIYRMVKAKDVPIVFDIREESWGDRHFAIVDPNGIGIDIVTYTKPED